ncbi:hypothetical protein [Marinomonas foliarum]|uniref:Uncharacterized protein n=1 Tax=Marinomonas foliarum TaxID=491950 RepID=A0A368ZMN3_9GAMM|nr:hypothetical protein [Marinomonas foliarum]RCW96312.1 hypothetical protein DFP77_13515 [Marinomonas foliarum]
MNSDTDNGLFFNMLLSGDFNEEQYQMLLCRWDKSKKEAIFKILGANLKRLDECGIEWEYFESTHTFVIKGKLRTLKIHQIRDHYSLVSKSNNSPWIGRYGILTYKLGAVKAKEYPEISYR